MFYKLDINAAKRIMIKAGWEFTHRDPKTGWYWFKDPQGRSSFFTLGGLRNKANQESMRMWFESEREKLRQGIQEELFDIDSYVV